MVTDPTLHGCVDPPLPLPPLHPSTTIPLLHRISHTAGARLLIKVSATHNGAQIHRTLDVLTTLMIPSLIPHVLQCRHASTLTPTLTHRVSRAQTRTLYPRAYRSPGWLVCTEDRRFGFLWDSSNSRDMVNPTLGKFNRNLREQRTQDAAYCESSQSQIRCHRSCCALLPPRTRSSSWTAPFCLPSCADVTFTAGWCVVSWTTTSVDGHWRHGASNTQAKCRSACATLGFRTVQ